MFAYDTTLSSLIIFAITLIVIYGIKSWLSHPANLPPMPCLPLPVFGHTLFMKPSVLQTCTRWGLQLGGIFTIYAHGKPAIIICSHKHLTEAFVKRADAFSNRPHGIRQTIALQDGSHGIAGSSGASWKEQRSVSLSILRSFGVGKNVMAQKISDEVEDYLNALSGLKGKAKDVQVLTNTSVSNVICAILLGERFHCDDPFFVEFIDKNKAIVQLMEPGSILNTLPWLRFLPGDLFGAKRLGRAFEDLKSCFSAHFIKKTMANVDDIAPHNFISAYLREAKRRAYLGGNTSITETNLRWIIQDLFVAGTETTSSTILWALVYAMRFPEYQDKVYREITEVVGTERVPDIMDRSKLNFLNAYIMETQRVGSITPVGLPHICSKTSTVGGYTIPKGCTVFGILDAILKDPSAWPDPHQFRPERFLDKDNNLLRPPSFIPYSLGRRICMGVSLARMELFLFLSALFQRFEILPETPNCPPSMEGIFGMTNAPKPFLVRFKQRR